uniref:Ig-like domain-containing protein n=1 Tax=Gouania willdenowi TaxID=441366 RepID=A0A8C5HJD1_GOUWI
YSSLCRDSDFSLAVNDGVFVFLHVSAQVSSSLHQERRLISVNVGDSVTLQKGTFHDEFKDEIRFTLKNEKYSLILTIYDVQVSDSATYYCAKSMPSYSLEFSEGTTVFVKVADFFINALVQQSDSKTIHPGDSVTLKCTASTGSCDAEPSVYWFKNSEDHHPSLIYTQSDKNSNAGTYYCAVTVCGRIVFGNGTRLELKGKKCCNMSNCLMIGYIKNTFIVKVSHMDINKTPEYTVVFSSVHSTSFQNEAGLSKCALAYLKRPRLWRVQRKGFFRITLPYSISLCKVR